MSAAASRLLTLPARYPAWCVFAAISILLMPVWYLMRDAALTLAFQNAIGLHETEGGYIARIPESHGDFWSGVEDYHDETPGTRYFIYTTDAGTRVEARVHDWNNDDRAEYIRLSVTQDERFSKATLYDSDHDGASDTLTWELTGADTDGFVRAEYIDLNLDGRWDTRSRFDGDGERQTDVFVDDAWMSCTFGENHTDCMATETGLPLVFADGVWR